MTDIKQKLPQTLTALMNSFNEKLYPLKKQMDLETTTKEVKIDNSAYSEIKAKYILKKSELYFEINFIVKRDLISWKCYPSIKDSSKELKKPYSTFNKNTNVRLKTDMEKWRDNVLTHNELSNPSEFFKKDKIIEAYANEFVNALPYIENEDSIPLPIKAQNEANALINKHIEFIDNELQKLNNTDTEKEHDLTNARTNLTELNENIPRMTISEVKKKMGLSFGTIYKWSKNKFIQFLNDNSKLRNDLTRLAGSFTGGLLGIPKLE